MTVSSIAATDKREYNGGMRVHPPAPSPDTLTHLARLDTALGVLAHGLARLLDTASPPGNSSPPTLTSLDPPTDAGLSVPSGERRLSATADTACTYGRSK